MNINSPGSTNGLQQTMNAQDTNMQRLASGKRVNSAADDAAGLQIIERMNAEATAYQRSVRNAFDGVSMLQVADGGMQAISNDMARLRELTVQAGNGALNDADRQALQAEVEQLREGIYQTIDTTSMGEQTLLNQDSSRGFLVGTGRGGDEQRVTVETRDLRAAGLDSLATIDLTNSAGVEDAINSIDDMQASLDSVRAEFGAQQNAFMSTISNLTMADVNTQSSRARIQDLDYAQATAERTRADIQGQAGLSIQAQANVQSRQVLQLLGTG
ncbi:flagellin [Aliidiomarina sp. Khilg15.8]